MPQPDLNSQQNPNTDPAEQPTDSLLTGGGCDAAGRACTADPPGASSDANLAAASSSVSAASGAGLASIPVVAGTGAGLAPKATVAPLANSGAGTATGGDADRAGAAVAASVAHGGNGGGGAHATGKPAKPEGSAAGITSAGPVAGCKLSTRSASPVAAGTGCGFAAPGEAAAGEGAVPQPGFLHPSYEDPATCLAPSRACLTWLLTRTAAQLSPAAAVGALRAACFGTATAAAPPYREPADTFSGPPCVGSAAACFARCGEPSALGLDSNPAPDPAAAGMPMVPATAGIATVPNAAGQGGDSAQMSAKCIPPGVEGGGRSEAAMAGLSLEDWDVTFPDFVEAVARCLVRHRCP